MPDGGPCAKPQPVADVEPLSALLERAAAYQAGWPDTVSTRHTLRQLWERLDVEVGERVRRLPDLLARMREAGMEVSEAAENVARTNCGPLPAPKRYVQAHLARDEAAAASGWTDSYMAACSRCGAARWEGCTAVDDEPDFGEPVPRVHVRLWNTEGTPHFMSIPWPDGTAAVARGLFEVSGALVPPIPGVLRPGLRPVPRKWESLDDEERDYWHTSVKGYLDGTREERAVGAVEWAALGAMVRVFGLQRKA
jgi:hypothetical protein